MAPKSYIFVCLLFTVSTLSGSWTQKLIHDKVGFSGKDVTPAVFGSYSNEMFPVAYADFNSDKITDILSLSRDQSTLYIFFGQDFPPPIFKPSIQCNLKENWEKLGFSGKNSPVKIVGVVTADFDGDSILDVMITFKRSPDVPLHPDDCVKTYGVETVILRGNLTRLDCDNLVDSPQVIKDLVDEPLALDINGDMIMDLFGEVYVQDPPHPNNQTTTTSCKSLRVQKKIWLFKSGSTTETRIFPPPPLNFTVANEGLDPHPNANCSTPSANSFADIDDDEAPELILITGSQTGSLWEYQQKTYRINLDDPDDPIFHLEHAPVDITYMILTAAVNPQAIGQPVIMDLNQNASLLQLVPFCSKLDCGDKAGKSGILVVTENGTVELQVDFGNYHYYVSKRHSKGLPPAHSNYTQTVTLRAGDFNLDGFPDLIGVLTKRGDPPMSSVAVLFENVPCLEPSCPYPRTFKINFDALSQYRNVTLATFFDLHEDGLVDVIVVRRTNDDPHPLKDTYAAFAFQNSPDYDAAFMKVMVLSGLPCQLCPQTQTPYGNLLSGPVIKYSTTTQSDHFQTAVAAQAYRSAHFSMDLPYTVFGVGQSANFIETLEISVSTDKDRRVEQWQQLIPNSQIIVIPAPLDKPGLWSAKLFLTPSRAVLNTGLVLIGFCTVICLIIGGLQWKERKDDMKERLQEAHRFHMM